MPVWTKVGVVGNEKNRRFRIYSVDKEAGLAAWLDFGKREEGWGDGEELND